MRRKADTTRRSGGASARFFTVNFMLDTLVGGAHFQSLLINIGEEGEGKLELHGGPIIFVVSSACR
jgi:hypothetical protein